MHPKSIPIPVIPDMFNRESISAFSGWAPAESMRDDKGMISSQDKKSWRFCTISTKENGYANSTMGA
jgi:hypothetical protein